MSEVLNRLRARDREHQLLGFISAQLQWDQETYLPRQGVAGRADQLAYLEGLLHEQLTASEYGELIAAAAAEQPTDETDAALVRELQRTYERRTKLPHELVTTIARQTSLNQAAWVEAREKADFNIFAPHLEETVRLTLRKVECLGYTDSPYDPLLDEFEPWMTTAELVKVLDQLRPPLTDLVRRIGASSVVADTKVLRRHYPVADQQSFSEQLLRAIGFDLERGRLDVSAHPFSTTLGPADSRLTTRYAADFISSSVFGTIHEGGHGMYEQGVQPELAQTSLGGGVSLGIHESQSRFWENVVGRSRPFWEHFLPHAQRVFPAALQGVEVDGFYRAINAVEPTLIRVEADEVTYNLHILLRFSLERRLVEGTLSVADAPEAWREESRDLLGVVPPDDAQGVLQDIHWSMFLIGYFPTYTLGNLYAAQFTHALADDLPDWQGQVQRGELGGILAWLRHNIHRHGKRYPAAELCRRVTGKSLDAQFFLDYLEHKYRDLYRL